MHALWGMYDRVIDTIPFGRCVWVCVYVHCMYTERTKSSTERERGTEIVSYNYINKYTTIHTYTYIHRYVYIYIYTHTCVCVCIYISCIYTHINAIERERESDSERETTREKYGARHKVQQ